MVETLGVGIVGANPERGWARISHVPAVQRLGGLRLAAVLGGSQASAEASKVAFGAERAYADPDDLFRDPAVNIVTIAVRVPAHRDLALGALWSGKHVYCEWPLGRDLAEAEELAHAARRAGRLAVIGLQGRSSPSLQRAAEMIRSGAIGRVLSGRMESGTAAFGPSTAKAETYLEDPANGATLVTIHAGHALDAAIAVLGPLSNLQAMTTCQFGEVAITGETETIARTIPDFCVTQSWLESGAGLSVEVAGGRTEAAKFRFEVVGDRGALTLESAAPRGFQSGRLALTVNGEQQRVDEGELAPLPNEAVNVGAVYAALRDDIRRGSTTLPGFDHAARLTRLLADLSASSDSATRRSAETWPEGI
ncbi:Gfo/Idh/MocA family protein [Hansschlegelia quercus]|uniref:Gfo/Idh/MocA family oxidoreductase n=1 Tax=Hansschlegelia quercus TaxID=2528245 RepID=A0A4Q9GK08_9HYPH|nr:Gfo/Idh/MocA family oxidoreductase [Hansschlegelia quercus]TBN52387.1 Gfo/Idh/MocA family oxidoreductase [Hansschlegelia quercus]